MNTTATIISIQELFDRWRAMGSMTLSSGSELIASIPDDEDIRWMHVVFPAESMQSLDRIESELGTEIPSRLRAFYRTCGGLSLFMGAFCLHGNRRAGFVGGDGMLQPEGLVELNHEIDLFDWKPKDAVAFASNNWDRSVHVAGMGLTPEEIVRCDRQTGTVMERNTDVFSCVESRLYHLDSLWTR